MSESETPTAAAPAEPNGWTKCYHVSGLLVTLPVRGANAVEMFAAVDAIIAAGFTVAAPGLEAGENKIECGWVMRTTQNKNGRLTPILHLYEPDNTWPTVKTYLNQPEDVAAFEFASGIKVDKIPDWPADSHIQRGTGKDNYVVKAPRPFGVVFRDNPKYDEKETDLAKKKSNGPARKFVRWADQKPESAPTNGAAPGAVDLDVIRKKWRDFFAMDPPVDVFNSFCKREWPEVPEGMRKALNAAINDHADKAGWSWDDQAKMFFTVGAPAPVGGTSNDPIPF